MSVPAGMELLLGNGSDELIQMLITAMARPGAAMMYPAPTFVMYSMRATFSGMRAVPVPLREDFSLDADAFIARMQAEKPALVFLAYPNNPTGVLYPALATLPRDVRRHRVLLGNGSDEIIQMLSPRVGRAASCCRRAIFVMYPMIATFCGMRYVRRAAARRFLARRRRLPGGDGGGAAGARLPRLSEQPDRQPVPDADIVERSSSAAGAGRARRGLSRLRGRSFMPRLASSRTWW